MGHATPILTVFAAMLRRAASELPLIDLTKSGGSDGLWHLRDASGITFLARGFQGTPASFLPRACKKHRAAARYFMRCRSASAAMYPNAFQPLPETTFWN